MRNREIHRHVIAKFKMQKGHIHNGAPIASVNRIAPNQIKRGGDRFSITLRYHQQHAITKPCAEQLPEIAREIGAATPFLIRSRAIEAMKGLPMARRNFCPAQCAQCQPCRLHIASFALQRLALARSQSAQEIIKITIARIGPMKLRTKPLQPAGITQGTPFGFRAEGGMDR